MEYRSIYDSVEAITYTGYNFKEINDFCGHRLSWESEDMDWSDDNPPIDLVVKFEDEEESDILVPGNVIVRFSSGHYGIIEGYDFIRLFEKVEKDE